MYHIIFSAAGLVQVHVFDFFFPIFSTLCRERGVVVEGSRLKIRNDKMTTKTIASTAVFFVKPHTRKHIICQSSPISSLAGQKKLTRNGDPYPFYDDGAIDAIFP